MAVQGYVTHAARNRRYAFFLALLYVLAFQLIGAFALIMPLLMWDWEHTILSHPLGYALRYAAPLAALSLLIFWAIYRGHAAHVARALRVRYVERREERRFVTIAEEVCTTLGVRAPRFGVIETEEPNALAAGAGPRGLIAVTRGLLNRLDDDELAAVLAHEAAHIRLGDTQALAANHALMRTAIVLQTQNPLRIEDWRQIFLLVFVPPMIPILLGSGAAAMLALGLARFARRGIKLTRDHIADGEAVRVTHFPDALTSAIRKIAGRGAFPGAWRVEALLFDGATDRDGGRHPSAADRIAAINALAGGLRNPARVRRDTREPWSAPFGRRTVAATSGYQFDREGRPVGPKPSAAMQNYLMYFYDREGFREWNEARLAWAEWRVSDQRNFVGLKPAMALPTFAVLGALGVVGYYYHGDLAGVVQAMNPQRLVNLVRVTHAGPFCYGAQHMDGRCGFASVGTPAANAGPPSPSPFDDGPWPAPMQHLIEGLPTIAIVVVVLRRVLPKGLFNWKD